MSKLGLVAWIAELKSVNLLFGQKYIERTREYGAANPDKLKEKREETMVAFYELRKFIDAYAVVNPGIAYVNLSNELNALITQYNELIPSHPVTSLYNKLKQILMILEQGNIYHIYNQGNNRQKIFFNRENYLYFLRKVKRHILPYADLLAWCLMPNHFHLLVAVLEDHDSDRVTPSHPVTSGTSPLNNAIATMLRSYTRAINIEQARTGSLFREGTKAIWYGSLKSAQIKYKNRMENISLLSNEEDDLQICFSYIHQNAVKAGLVKKATEWEFSSFRDIAELSSGSLINKYLISGLGLHL